jgi:hypothetical protein
VLQSRRGLLAGGADHALPIISQLGATRQ